jgi:uncharacterized RDD family membrane protein YckC
MSGSPAPTAPAPSQAQGEYASWLRRVCALAIDWAACQAVAYAIVRNGHPHAESFLPLLIFFVESAVGVALVGASFGQLLARIRVHRIDGRPLELLQSFLRALLVCLVIPPLVFKPDGRGLHDMAVGSAAYRLL